MSTALIISLNWVDWSAMFTHFIGLSMLSIGGAMSTLPEMHRYLVVQQHWLTEQQFTASVAIAQASPGPNVLFIALLGWNVGVNTGSLWAGLLGLTLSMAGILLPSTTFTYFIAGWLRTNRERIAVRAFKQGMAPIVIALLISTGWLMMCAQPKEQWQLWVVTLVATVLVWRTKIHMLWFIAAGAILGALGWV